MMRSIAKPVCFFLIISYSMLDFSVHTARAAMVGTETALNTTEGRNARTRLVNFLNRQDVQTVMVQQGVRPEEARARINSLTDTEVNRISGMMDRLPAGGDAVGALIGAALFVFIVLLITDILGLTRVYSFVNHPAPRR